MTLLRRGAGVLLAVSALQAAPALAFQPLITDDTGTQGAGGNQLEFASNWQELKSEGDTTKTDTLALVFTRGITDALDIYAGVSHGQVRSSNPTYEAHGHSNPVLGLKWRLYENEDKKFGVAVKPEIQFGAPADYERLGLGNGHSGYSGLIIFSQETNFGALHINYGFTLVNYALESNRTDHRRKLHRLSLAPVFDVGAGWKLGIDLGLTTNSHRTERATMGYAELGAIWSPSEDLDFALGAIRFVGDGELRSHTLTAGVTWRFR
ncbi:MAG: hypothetical protein EHM59_08495 [Betaproteobacteria bacterium]|nr:MAG: hypothetical protein EHM59_08495 [Betaproteobacteria bacterium]